MSKEMIISVNGREKKIAILDNGRVSEFYIERGEEENSGIVGNIYKGRVMRVLPGMQSAFVEIGLERDAFLYVSDFFDEEEEIERIVMEKSKKSSPEEAKREADEQIQKARIEREKQMEAVQELAEPLAETATEIFAGEDEAGEAETDSAKAETKEDFQRDRQGKSRRGKRERQEAKNAESREENKSESSGSEFREIDNLDFTGNFTEISSDETSQFDSAPLFEMEDSGFERIVDEEETTGEIFKDAYLQEAITDKVRAVEFDMESTASAEVGSLLDSVTNDGGFERIADEDEETAAVVEKPKSRRGGRGGKKAKTDESAAETASTEETQNVESISAETEESKPKKGAGKSKKAEPETETEMAESAKPKTSRKKDRGGKKAKKETVQETDNGGETMPDAEAGVKETDAPAQMAVRRGGRNRRRSNDRPEYGAKPEQESANAANANEPNFEPETEKPYFQSGGNKQNYRSEGGKNEGNRQRNGNGNNRRERERNQPTITDLLREGQEILVQIAKEPIAKKGARITSHIALPGRFLVYMPTIEHLGVSRKIESSSERGRLRTAIQKIRAEEDIPSGGFIVRTAGVGVSEQDLRQDARYLVRTWLDMKKKAEKSKSPALVHQDLDIIQRLLRDQLSDDFTAIRVDSEDEYQRIVEFINRIQPRMVNRVKLYTRDTPILEEYGVQEEVDKALKPRVWLKSGGYLVINQTEALVAIDVNTGKFVGKGNARLEDTITKTNMEAVEEIARQIRLRDLGGIIVLDLIDMEDRRNRHKVSQALQEALAGDKSPTKVLSFNDFGLIIMTRKRVKQSLERTMCAPCEYCEGAGWVKSAQTVCFEILEEARRLAKNVEDIRSTTLRVHPEVAKALNGAERMVLEEIEAHLGNIDVTGDKSIHQQQFDFAFV